MRPRVLGVNALPRACHHLAHRRARIAAVRVSIDCRYLRERPSGIGTYVRALIDRLPARAPADRFHLWASPQATLPLSHASNVDETLVRVEANHLPTLAWPARLVPLADVDVLHMPYNILGRGVSCATVVTVHDIMWLTDPSECEASPWRRAYQAPFYRAGILMALRNASRIIAISEATAAAIRRALPAAASRMAVIHHGVESRFRPAIDASAARAACVEAGVRGPFYLAMGQNAPYKNHGAVLEAFAAAKLERDTKLVFVQRLNPGGSLALQAERLGIAARVVWLAGAEPELALALLQSALGLIQYSRIEGFGMPALEAMACATPVIVSDTPALAEIVENAGIRVPLGDIPGLALAMSRIGGEPSRRAELGALGLQRAAQFSWDDCAARHLEVYREAAARPSH
ncbi:MAG: glycosyltransferase family 1 protein [Myxococcales bacterium]|nr:glycosyltransferase family 1 protein [Myxococcales bacterium]